MLKMPCFSRSRSECDLLRAGGIGRRNREFKWAEQGVFSTEQGIFRRNSNIVGDGAAGQSMHAEVASPPPSRRATSGSGPTNRSDHRYGRDEWTNILAAGS